MNTAVRNLAQRRLRVVSAPTSKAELRAAVSSAPEPAALAIGGSHPRYGWLATDVEALTRHRHAGGRWPFRGGTLGYVYADNVIEHLPIEVGRGFLGEAHRCLGAGGVLRLVTPDIRRHVELYLDGLPAMESEIARRYRSVGVLVEHPVDLVRIPIGEFGHHAGHVYDFEALAVELHRVGFSSVRRVPVGESDHERLVGLEFPHGDAEARLVVEATH